MLLTDLEKASQIYEKIKIIDGEIKIFQQYAEILANKKTESVLEFNIHDIEKHEENEKNVSFNEDGDLESRTRKKNTFMMAIPFGFGFTDQFENKNIEPNSDCLHKYQKDINAGLMLKILSLLLFEKLKERKTLTNELQEKYNIKVK